MPNKEIKKAFTFVKLGVPTQPEDILNSEKSLLYMESIESSPIPNCLTKTENPFDELIGIIDTHGIVCDTFADRYGEKIPPCEYENLLAELDIAIRSKIINACIQNINIIYQNGLRSYIEHFSAPQDFENFMKSHTFIAPDKNLDMLASSSIYRPFCKRTLKQLPPYCDEFYNKANYEIELDPKSIDTMLNLMEYIRVIMTKVTACYTDIINAAMRTPGLIDQAALANYALSKDHDIDFSKVPSTLYNSICYSVLNQAASEDLGKISEIVEANVAQGNAEFYKYVSGMSIRKREPKTEEVK